MTKNVLVALDLEHDALTDRLLSVACEMAKMRGAGLELLTVIEAMPVEAATFLPPEYERSAREKVGEELAKLAAKLDLKSGKATCSVRFGSIYREILAQAEHSKADLIVIGCHAPDVGDFLLGSNAARVVRHAACSVFVVR